MRAKVLSAAAVVAALGAMPPATAALVPVTVWRTVSSGYDQTGVFGPAGQSLVGDSYEARYLFNTALGLTLSNPTKNYALGGTNFGVPSPAVSASVTINGVTVTIGGDYIGYIFGSNNGYWYAVSCGRALYCYWIYFN